MFCKNCGAQLNGTDAVCPNCGTSIENNLNQISHPGEVNSVVQNSDSTMNSVNAQPVSNDTVSPSVSMDDNMSGNINQPYVAQPNNVQPNIAQPNNVQPNIAQPSIEQPSIAQPNIAQPSIAQPNIAQPSIAQPNIAQPSMTAQPGMQPTTQNTPSNGNNKTVKLVICLVGAIVFAAIALSVIFIGMKKDKKLESSTLDTVEDVEKVGTNSDSSASYAGYTFTIPEGYSHEVTTQGLAIANNKNGFLIEVDYSNSYDEYKAGFAQKYPTQYNDIVNAFDGREYLIVRDDSEPTVSYFVTKANESSVFIGGIVNIVGGIVSQEHYQILTTILDSTNNKTSFAAGATEDAGKNGMVDFSNMDLTFFNK